MLKTDEMYIILGTFYTFVPQCLFEYSRNDCYNTIDDKLPIINRELLITDEQLQKSTLLFDWRA